MQRVAIVTGASRGIGLEIARGLAARGYHVVLTARELGRAEAAARAAGAAEAMALDVADLANVRTFAQAFRARHLALHLLVNNAGIHTARAERSPQGFELTMATNHLGHFLLTTLLLDALRRGGSGEETARIVNVASEAHRGARRVSLDPPPGLRAYVQSKLANVMFTYALARRVEGSGVAAHAVHPGSVRSGWARGEESGLFRFAAALAAPFLVTPEEGARTPLYAATAPELAGTTGGYFVRSKPRASSAASRDVKAQERLWEESARAVGL